MFLNTGVDSFSATTLTTVTFNGVLSEPCFEVIKAGAAVYRENQCDAILAIGGGSAIDAAKVIGIFGVFG